MNQQLEEILTNCDRELKLIKTDEKIDINQPDWVEIAQRNALEYKRQIHSIIEEVRIKICMAIAANDERISVENLKRKIDSTEVLKKHLRYSIEELKNSDNNELEAIIKRAIFFFILKDMDPDPRDEMIYFKDLVNTARLKQINYKKIIMQLIKYAGEDVKVGVDLSTKKFLQGFIQDAA